jgi:hypothetical protein
MDEQIDALSVANEILRDARIPRQDDRVTGVVYPVAERRPHGGMVHVECRDCEPILFECDPFVDVLGEEQGASCARRCIAPLPASNRNACPPASIKLLEPNRVIAGTGVPVPRRLTLIMEHSPGESGSHRDCHTAGDRAYHDGDLQPAVARISTMRCIEARACSCPVLMAGTRTAAAPVSSAASRPTTGGRACDRASRGS